MTYEEKLMHELDTPNLAELGYDRASGTFRGRVIA